MTNTNNIKLINYNDLNIDSIMNDNYYITINDYYNQLPQSDEV